MRHVNIGSVHNRGEQSKTVLQNKQPHMCYVFVGDVLDTEEQHYHNDIIRERMLYGTTLFEICNRLFVLQWRREICCFTHVHVSADDEMRCTYVLR